MIRFMVGSSFGLLSISTYMVSKHNPFWIVVLARSIFPTLIGNIYVYGIQKWLTFKFGLINTDIVDKQLLEKEYFEEE